MNGKGQIFKKEGKIEYDGNFLNNNYNRKGIEYFKNGEYYGIDFINGKKQGKGVIYYSNHNPKYNWDFVDDKFEGNAIAPLDSLPEPFFYSKLYYHF